MIVGARQETLTKLLSYKCQISQKKRERARANGADNREWNKPDTMLRKECKIYGNAAN